MPIWSGTVYVATVIDAFARRIGGWRASPSMKTPFVLPSRQLCVAKGLPGKGRVEPINMEKKTE